MSPPSPAALNRDPEQVRAEIQKARRQIASSVTTLKSELATTTDWREWIRQRPVPVLLGAFALGFVVGNRFFKD